MSVKQLLRKHSSEQSEHYFFAFLLSHKCLMNHEPETSHQQFSLPKNTRDLNMSKLFWCFYLVQESCLFESELDTRVPFKCFISLSTGCPKKPILLPLTLVKYVVRIFWWTPCNFQNRKQSFHIF